MGLNTVNLAVAIEFLACEDSRNQIDEVRVYSGSGECAWGGVEALGRQSKTWNVE